MSLPKNGDQRIHDYKAVVNLANCNNTSYDKKGSGDQTDCEDENRAKEALSTCLSQIQNYD